MSNTKEIITPEEKSKKVTKLIKNANKSKYFNELDESVIELDRVLNGQLNQIKNANTICSVDMEFSNRVGDVVVEIGISIYDRKTKETFSEHFIIEEQVGQYKRNNTPMEHILMFAHGTSKTVSLESAMKVLNNLMNNSDVSIIYAQENKYKHMLKHNFKDDSFINIQDLMRMNSRNGLKMALSSAVQEFGTLEQPVKNAGNDAAVALEIVSNVFGDKIDFKNYESPVVTDYSTHAKKMSGAKIKELRNNNPTPLPNDKYTAEEVAQTKKIKL